MIIERVSLIGKLTITTAEELMKTPRDDLLLTAASAIATMHAFLLERKLDGELQEWVNETKTDIVVGWGKK